MILLVSLGGTGLGTLQVVLDKGQREDWFAHLHNLVQHRRRQRPGLLYFLGVASTTSHHSFRLFKNRNFAATNAMMLLFGAVLLASTVLIPQFVQAELGYTAQKAGEVLSPGGVMVLIMLPSWDDGK